MSLQHYFVALGLQIISELNLILFFETIISICASSIYFNFCANSLF